MPKKDITKVDLSLIKKLVSDLEAVLRTADGLNQEATINDWISEMAKGSGLAAQAAQEASLLVHDIYALIRASQGLTSKKTNEDLIDQIFGGPLKGTGDGTAN